METLVPLALFFCIAYCVVGVTRAVTDARTRRRLIESGASMELVRATIGEPPRREPYPWLLWGIVLGAVGLALMGVQFLPYQPDDPLPTGLVVVAGAVGLIAAQLVGRRLTQRGGGAPTIARVAGQTPLSAPAHSAPALSAPALPAAAPPTGAPVAMPAGRGSVSPSTPFGADDLE